MWRQYNCGSGTKVLKVQMTPGYLTAANRWIEKRKSLPWIKDIDQRIKQEISESEEGERPPENRIPWSLDLLSSRRLSWSSGGHELNCKFYVSRQSFGAFKIEASKTLEIWMGVCLARARSLTISQLASKPSNRHGLQRGREEGKITARS